MKRLPIFTLATLLILSTLQCQTEKFDHNIQRDFARFDGAYLPVLFYAYENNTYQAKRAVFHLEYHWQQLRNRYEFARPESDWRNTFRRVNEQLSEAYTDIDANNQGAALIQLERAKVELKNLRANYDIKYYLDDLYEFQASVDVIKTTTEDEMLDMLQWEDVMDMAANIDNQWIAMQTQHFDGALFEFDNTKLWKYRTAMQTVTEKVKLLNEAMNNADRIKVANASGRLDLAVLEVLRMFGDFETADTYYAQRHFNNNELISLRN